MREGRTSGACAACGHENREGRKFCTRCGAALAATCPSCASPTEPGEQFCGECGAALPTPAMAESPLAEAPAEAPANRSHLEGERKQVTVLFADLKGSMALSEGRDPEEWAEVMGRFFSICAEAVTRFEGTVDKFTGDGLMAIFGAPLAQEDHARRACLAAWHLAEAVGVWAEETLADHSLDLHVRVGLNSGEVVAGRIGGEDTAEYTAVGHTVGLAQRMEAMAEPGRVYLTERTARLVSGQVGLTDLGRLEVKGVSEPVGVFALESARMAGRSPAVRFAEAPPLVGRDEEMAALESALARAEEGQAQVVGIVGEAGVGKSRLCEELASRCGARGLDVRRTAGISHGQSVPLLPVLVMLRDYFGIGDADTPQKARGFPAAILRQMAALPEDDLFGALAALCAAEFLQEETAGDEAAYRFWHPLTQEVAYATLLAGARRRLHAAAARAIIDLEPDRLDERAALVASHWERGGDDLEAARWNAAAAAWARRSDLTEAMRRWRTVLPHLAKVPETEEVLRLGIGARIRLCQFGARTGMAPEEAVSLLAEGRLLAERLGDRAQLAFLTAVQGTIDFGAGRVRDGAASQLEAAHVGDELGQPGLMGGTLMARFSGRIPEAIHLADRALALCAGDPDLGAEVLGYSPLARAHINRAELFSVAGRLQEAGQEADRGLDVARARSELELVGWSLTLSPRLADFAGEVEDALAPAEEAVRICADSGNLMVHVLALEAVGIAKMVLERWDEAIEAFELAINDSHTRMRSNFDDASVHAYLARAHLALGDQKAARQHADDALSVAQEQGARVLECVALLARAQVRRAAGEPADAIAADLDAALALVHETGALTYEPFIREELGRLRDDPAELREALRRFTAIGATGHARRLESTGQ